MMTEHYYEEYKRASNDATRIMYLKGNDSGMEEVQIITEIMRGYASRLEDNGSDDWVMGRKKYPVEEPKFGGGDETRK